MKISESTFTIVANGFADGPSQALRDYLLEHGAKRVVVVSHPLVPESKNHHIIRTYELGEVRERVIRLPHKPPYTYLLDPFIPFRLPKDDVWFGFNNLACLRGLARRKTGRSKKVVYWAVDFVQNRFGKGATTQAYNSLDKYTCNTADFRVELSKEGADGRNKYLGLDNNAITSQHIIPMGAWLSRTPKINSSAWAKQRLVYMGHLVERQGVEHAVGALAIILKKYPNVTLDIVGSGPELNSLRETAKKLKIGTKRIVFHGFVKDHKDVERILADATIALAPYLKLKDSFSQTADPGKIKAYLGGSLPIVMTDVPPIAQEVKDCGAGILVEDNAVSIAEAVSVYLSDEKTWLKAHKASEKKAKEFDWENLLGEGLASLGLS